MHLMKTVISHSLQKIHFGSIMVENAYFLSYPNEVSKFRKFPHYQLINYKWKFFWQQVEEPRWSNQHSEDSCHLKQEELVLCTVFITPVGKHITLQVEAWSWLVLYCHSCLLLSPCLLPIVLPSSFVSIPEKRFP